jgi:sialidase-1
VVERLDGSLLLNMRSYHKQNRRAVSVSTDGGETWSEPKLDPALIEPVCQASLIRYGKGRSSVLLFSNPADAKRVNMTVKLSRDDGETWPVAKTIHAGPSAYSNLAELPDKMVGLLYERGEKDPYETITFVRFPLSWLTR